MPKNIFSFQKADFHMHSVFSDGTDSPEELLDKIKIAGIDVFSLTDHDTCAGCEQMSALIKNDRAPYFIPGIEFSTEDEHGKYHILGYGFRMEGFRGNAGCRILPRKPAHQGAKAHGFSERRLRLCVFGRRDPIGITAKQSRKAAYCTPLRLAWLCKKHYRRDRQLSFEIPRKGRKAHAAASHSNNSLVGRRSGACARLFRKRRTAPFRKPK